MKQTNSVRVAVITGASSGIGLAAARELAAQGYELLICARAADKLETVAEEIRSSGGVVRTFQCDVSDPGQVNSLAENATAHWDHIDILFNNAGTGKAVSLEDTTDALWAETIGSSLAGTFYCARAFLPLLKSAKDPVIINNASIAAHRGFPNFSAYSAAKGGVVSFSRALREELRPLGIRVTTLSAGATASPFWDDVEGEWDTTRMMTCESVGQLIAHIAAMPVCAQMEEVLLMPSGGAL